MKKFLDVEATRRSYHADRARNSVHRASLLVPELPGSDVDISFLNHFLLKRGYENVACRVTAIDPAGKRIVSRLTPVTDPRVYRIPLSGMVEDAVDSYMVEFFSADNLFIPFPAVMINHHGDGFVNSVHAYNRVLNDVFEDDDTNTVQQREAAIDVRCDAEAETFLVFQAGPQPVKGPLTADLKLPDGRMLQGTIDLDVPKLCRRVITISELFDDLPYPLQGGTLTVMQPYQFMFYGRMLVGQKTPDGRLSANHSYYDCSTIEEYWEDDRPSSRVYPYMKSFDNVVRFYPIMSPGELEIGITLVDHVGQTLADERVGRVSAPDGAHLEQSISALAGDKGLDESDVAAFHVSAYPLTGNTPTRVNHQLVYRSSGLESSINISLGNPNSFVPAGKTGFSWGQVPVGSDLSSFLGIHGIQPSPDTAPFKIRFYSEEGFVSERTIDIPGNGATVLDARSVLPESAAGGDSMLWYQISSERPDTNAISTIRHRETGHAVGEHAF